MNKTKLQDLINPEVMADMISAQLPAQLRFSAVAEVDNTLEGQPGNTITIPAYKYIGDAADVAEGEPIPVEGLATESSQVTIKKAGKGTEITDESILSGYGDPLGESQNQLMMAIANKVDNDALDALLGATLHVDRSEEEINPDAISDAIDLFLEESDEARILYVSPKQVGQLRKSDAFTRASDLGDEVLVKGAIGEIYGCQVVPSRKVVAEDGKYTNLLVKPGALAIYLKRKPEMESDRDIIKKTTVLTADQHYGVAIKDVTKVAKLIVKE